MAMWVVYGSGGRFGCHGLGGGYVVGHVVEVMGCVGCVVEVMGCVVVWVNFNSKFGWCEKCSSSGSPTTTTPSPTSSGGGGGDVGSLISAFLFDQMLKYRNNPRCKSNGFYTYNAFIAAA
ncbi:endochitinase [Quercus suber]|uniref:Endochitinase n=1 Tax=Quercus suber TaxID=58331 RepID=A0AAW0JN55_QUESU